MYEGKRVEIPVNGKTKHGMKIEIDEENLKWSEVKLKDGTILWMKINLQEVTRLEEYDAEGNPIYMVAANPVVQLSYVPREVKKKLVTVMPRIN